MKYGYLGSYDISCIHELPSEELLKERGLYVIVNTVSHKVYVGKTDKSFKYRFDGHEYALSHNASKNRHLQRSWNEYGSDAFIFCILRIARHVNTSSPKETYILRKETALQEIDTIKQFRKIIGYRMLYNQNDGGDGGVDPTPELSALLSQRDRESWKRESTRKRRIEGIKRTCKKNSESGKLHQVQKDTWKNESTRNARVSGIKKAYKDSVKKQRHLDGVRKFYASPEGKAQLERLKYLRWKKLYDKIESVMYHEFSEDLLKIVLR